MLCILMVNFLGLVIMIWKSKYIYIIIVVVVILLSIFYGFKNLNKKNSEPEINFALRKALSDFENLKNNKISFIKDLFVNIDKTKQEINYLLIYDDYSCPPCNEKAKLMAKQITDSPVYIFYLLKKDKYKKNVTYFYAKSDSVFYYLERFKSITTPVILKFDSTFKVLDAFFPTIHKDEEFKDFIDK